MVETGANPDELRRTASLMAGGAQRLEEISRHLTASLMASPWQGRSADAFRSDWNLTHRGGLATAARYLRQGHDALLRNADQQLQASAPEASDQRGSPGSTPDAAYTALLTAPGLFALLGSLGTSWLDSPASTAFAVTDKVQGLLGFISRNKTVTGRYTDAWRTVMQHSPHWGIPGSWLKFKSSPVMQGLNHWLHPSEGLLRNTGAVFSDLGYAGLALSLFGRADRFGSALGRREYVSAGITGAETTADLLKTAKAPVPYLSGVAVQTYSELAKAVKENADSGNFTQAEWDRVTHAGWRVWAGGVSDTITKSLPGMAARIFL